MAEEGEHLRAPRLTTCTIKESLQGLDLAVGEDSEPLQRPSAVPARRIPELTSGARGGRLQQGFHSQVEPALAGGGIAALGRESDLAANEHGIGLE